MPRIDCLCITPEGAFTWVKGVANEFNPKKPVIPSTSLAIASVYQNWRKDEVRQVVNDGVRVVPFSDMEALTKRVDFALTEIARQRLEADVSTREAGARVSIFVDPLLDDSKRDQGIPQTAAVVQG